LRPSASVLSPDGKRHQGPVNSEQTLFLSDGSQFNTAGNEIKCEKPDFCRAEVEFNRAETEFNRVETEV
jgi:hypothetical protein